MIGADDRWDAALAAVGASRGDPGAVFDELRCRYASPSRHHHDLAHASSVVDTVLALHTDGGAWAPVVLAGWYHDVVYDPTAASGVNEGASAVLAAHALESLGATLTHVGEVARLICGTTTHSPRPGDHNGAVLTDADLCILAADEDRYDRYVDDVRAEYCHVPDDQWRAGRTDLLRSFLARGSIFYTDFARTRWERVARSNISRELETLSR